MAKRMGVKTIEPKASHFSLISHLDEITRFTRYFSLAFAARGRISSQIRVSVLRKPPTRLRSVSPLVSEPPAKPVYEVPTIGSQYRPLN